MRNGRKTLFFDVHGTPFSTGSRWVEAAWRIPEQNGSALELAVFYTPRNRLYREFCRREALRDLWLQKILRII